MAYMCNLCFEVYKDSIVHLTGKIPYFEEIDCPKRECRGVVVQIDDIILPTIILLNEKGYDTKFCCSGHATPDCIDMYIAFDFAREDYKDRIPLPEGFELDDDAGLFIIRHRIDTVDDDECDTDKMHMDILKHAGILHEWAKRLQPWHYIEVQE